MTDREKLIAAHENLGGRTAENSTSSAQQLNPSVHSSSHKGTYHGSPKPNGEIEEDGGGKAPQSPIRSIPLSPSQKAKHFVSSPVRFAKRSVDPGSVESSTFSLIIICMGATTVTVPLIYYENGPIVGSLFIIFGGCLSFFSAYLIAFCCEFTGGTRYEDIAMSLYGVAGLKFTSFCNILCNIGFLVTYIVLFKNLMPYTINLLLMGESKDASKALPNWIGDTSTGHIVWAFLFTYSCVFPLSLPRKLTALRFTSFMSFAISMFIVCTIFAESFAETKDTCPTDCYDFKDRWAEAVSHPKVSISGIFDSLPLIIFAFMYQPNTPAIYTELKIKSLPNIKKVLGAGTTLASVCYIVVGMFGYATFAKRSDISTIMSNNMILENDYHGSLTIKLCLFGMLMVVLFACPFCVLPVKDSIEEISCKKGETLSMKSNIIWTFVLVSVSVTIALVVPTISDAMTILGATTNSGIGFLLPIHFYFKTQKDNKKLTNMKIMCYVIYVVICISSVITMYTFIKGKTEGKG